MNWSGLAKSFYRSKDRLRNWNLLRLLCPLPKQSIECHGGARIYFGKMRLRASKRLPIPLPPVDPTAADCNSNTPFFCHPRIGVPHAFAKSQPLTSVTFSTPTPVYIRYLRIYYGEFSQYVVAKWFFGLSRLAHSQNSRASPCFVQTQTCGNFLRNCSA
jgi:hypothetical protein